MSTSYGNQMQAENYLGRSGGYNANVAGVAGQTMGAGLGNMNQWRGRIDPLYGSMSEQAFRSPQYGIDRAATDVAQGFDRTQGVLNRSLGRMGINPNSGRFVGMNQKWGLARAAAEAGAMTRARRAAEDQNYARQSQLLGVGMQGYNQGAGMLQNAAGMYETARRGAADAARDYGLLSNEQRADETYKVPTSNPSPTPEWMTKPSNWNRRGGAGLTVGTDNGQGTSAFDETRNQIAASKNYDPFPVMNAVTFNGGTFDPYYDVGRVRASPKPIIDEPLTSEERLQLAENPIDYGPDRGPLNEDIWI